MIRSKKRMAVCLILLVLNIAFIWGNSLLPRELSSAFSKMIGAVLQWLFPGPVNPSEGEGHGILRKIAHFAEFTTLGMLLSWHVAMVKDKKWHKIVLPILAGFLVAAVDETIQYFVPGRGPGVLDVAIDTAGVVLGVGVFTCLAWLFINKKQVV